MAFNTQQPSWTPFNLYALTLWGKPWNNEDKKTAPRFYPYVSEDGSLCFGIYFNDGKIRDAIRVKLDAVTAEMLFEIINRVISSPPDKPYKRKLSKTSMYSHRGKISDKPTEVLTFSIGKTDDGVVYLAIQPVGERMAVFPFNEGLPFGLNVCETNNEKVATAELSELRAKAWINIVRQFYINHLFFKQKKPPEKEQSGKGSNFSSGSSFNNSSQSSNEFQSDPSFSDDLGF